MENAIVNYLEKSFQNTPDKIALVDECAKITYAQWRNRALDVASAICDRLQKRKVPVLIYLPKSITSLVSFMGVLYSGNFYTPTDVKFPFEKVNTIIQSLEPELIISTREVSDKLIENGVSENLFLYVEDIKEGSFRGKAMDYTDKIIDCDLAYVLFTSGSTGVPKGVGITHRSIIDFVDWVQETFGIDEKQHIANQTPFYFDMSVLDIYTTLRVGATLYIVPEKTFLFPVDILEYIKENEISFLCWVPTVFKNISNMKLLEKVDCSCLKYIFFAGEVMPNKVLNYFRRNLPNAMYANLFGPTELTDICTYYIVNREFADNDPLPIGYPCKNIDAFILSEEDKLVTEQGVVGELCVRGTCLAMGYYKNPEITEKAFVKNPLNDYFYEKIYRTGDLVHYNSYGEFEYDGRKDFQIKHMGYRIELGEIETALLAIENIYNGCVLYDNVNEEIVAIYVAKEEVDKRYIRKELISILPKYMIPTKYIALDEMPYNDNGKIDRKQLSKLYMK